MASATPVRGDVIAAMATLRTARPRPHRIATRARLLPGTAAFPRGEGAPPAELDQKLATFRGETVANVFPMHESLGSTKPPG
jgi:hypothetical protein